MCVHVCARICACMWGVCTYMGAFPGHDTMLGSVRTGSWQLNSWPLHWKPLSRFSRIQVCLVSFSFFILICLYFSVTCSKWKKNGSDLLASTMLAPKRDPKQISLRLKKKLQLNTTNLFSNIHVRLNPKKAFGEYLIVSSGSTLVCVPSRLLASDLPF